VPRLPLRVPLRHTARWLGLKPDPQTRAQPLFAASTHLHHLRGRGLVRRHHHPLARKKVVDEGATLHDAKLNIWLLQFQHSNIDSLNRIRKIVYLFKNIVEHNVPKC
jgi:hypothetical protein